MDYKTLRVNHKGVTYHHRDEFIDLESQLTEARKENRILREVIGRRGKSVFNGKFYNNIIIDDNLTPPTKEV